MEFQLSAEQDLMRDAGRCVVERGIAVLLDRCDLNQPMQNCPLLDIVAKFIGLWPTAPGLLDSPARPSGASKLCAWLVEDVAEPSFVPI